jgi:hypothetical protein
MTSGASPEAMSVLSTSLATLLSAMLSFSSILSWLALKSVTTFS